MALEGRRTTGREDKSTPNPVIVGGYFFEWERLGNLMAVEGAGGLSAATGNGRI